MRHYHGKNAGSVNCRVGTISERVTRLDPSLDQAILREHEWCTGQDRHWDLAIVVLQDRAVCRSIAVSSFLCESDAIVVEHLEGVGSDDLGPTVRLNPL